MGLFSIVVGHAVEKYLNSKNLVAVHVVQTDGKPETILSTFAPGIDINPADGENLVVENIKGASNFKAAVGGVNQLITPDTERGERRFYSVSEDGKTIMAVIKLKNDGTMILNDGTESAVLYGPLETAYNELNDKFNDLVTAFNSHVHVVTTPDTINGTASPIVSPSQPSTGDITPAESEKITLS